MTDYYDLLGVEPDADKDAIKAAYRDRARGRRPGASGPSSTRRGTCCPTRSSAALRRRAAPRGRARRRDDDDDVDAPAPVAGAVVGGHRPEAAPPRARRRRRGAADADDRAARGHGAAPEPRARNMALLIDVDRADRRSSSCANFVGRRRVIKNQYPEETDADRRDQREDQVDKRRRGRVEGERRDVDRRRRRQEARERRGQAATRARSEAAAKADATKQKRDEGLTGSHRRASRRTCTARTC